MRIERKEGKKTKGQKFMQKLFIHWTKRKMGLPSPRHMTVALQVAFFNFVVSPPLSLVFPASDDDFSNDNMYLAIQLYSGLHGSDDCKVQLCFIISRLEPIIYLTYE